MKTKEGADGSEFISLAQAKVALLLRRTNTPQVELRNVTTGFGRRVGIFDGQGEVTEVARAIVAAAVADPDDVEAARQYVVLAGADQCAFTLRFLTRPADASSKSLN